MRYLFEEYAFDTELRELYRGADAVSIAPQVFDLLDFLIRNRERVVSRADIINAIWNGRAVSDAALTADFGEQGGGLTSRTHNGATLSISPATPRLSIVVLPFANIGGDSEQDYFVDGVTESLTTDLSRISGSFVIARNTAFTFKGKAVDVKQVGRELSVRYVLEGSVQRGGNRLRVNVQLIDAETGNHLWAERFEKPVADLFDTQDEIVSRLANTLNAQLIEVEARRAGRSTHPDALDLYF